MQPETSSPCIGRLIIQKEWLGKQRMLFVQGLITCLVLSSIAAFMVTLALQNIVYITVCGVLMIILLLGTLGCSFYIDYYDRAYQLKKSFEVPDHVYQELKVNDRMLRLIAVDLTNRSIQSEKEIHIQ